MAYKPKGLDKTGRLAAPLQQDRQGDETNLILSQFSIVSTEQELVRNLLLLIVASF